jgi:hypothetical protein
MLFLLVIASLNLQAAQPAGDTVVDPETVIVEKPTDAATLIAEFESRYEAFGGIVTELAARKARARYLRSLLIPVISRSDLDPGARNEILNQTADTLQSVELDNTAWAVSQLDPEVFGALYSENSRLALDILRWAERDDRANVRIIAALEPLATAGTFDANTYAALVDVHAVSESRPQVYGTQEQCVDGRRELWPLVAADETEKQRAALGLLVLEEDWAARLATDGSNCPDGETE